MVGPFITHLAIWLVLALDGRHLCNQRASTCDSRFLLGVASWPDMDLFTPSSAFQWVIQSIQHHFSLRPNPVIPQNVMPRSMI